MNNNKTFLTLIDNDFIDENKNVFIKVHVKYQKYFLDHLCKGDINFIRFNNIYVNNKSMLLNYINSHAKSIVKHCDYNLMSNFSVIQEYKNFEYKYILFLFYNYLKYINDECNFNVSYVLSLRDILKDFFNIYDLKKSFVYDDEFFLNHMYYYFDVDYLYFMKFILCQIIEKKKIIS